MNSEGSDEDSKDAVPIKRIGPCVSYWKKRPTKRRERYLERLNAGRAGYWSEYGTWIAEEKSITGAYQLKFLKPGDAVMWRDFEKRVVWHCRVVAILGNWDDTDARVELIDHEGEPIGLVRLRELVVRCGRNREKMRPHDARGGGHITGKTRVLRDRPDKPNSQSRDVVDKKQRPAKSDVPTYRGHPIRGERNAKGVPVLRDADGRVVKFPRRQRRSRRNPPSQEPT